LDLSPGPREAHPKGAPLEEEGSLGGQ